MGLRHGEFGDGHLSIPSTARPIPLHLRHQLAERYFSTSCTVSQASSVPAQRNCSNTGSCLEREESRSDACCLPGLQRPTRHLANDTMRGRKPGRNGNGREHEAHQPDPGLRPRKLPSGPTVHRHASVYDVPAAGYHAGLIQTWSEPVLPAISLPTLFRPSVSAHIAFDACTPDLVRSLCHR